jgi:PPOX class probable F420-dependent enzyme
VGLKHWLSDLNHRYYDSRRHEAAFARALEPGTATDFSSLHGHKYAVLVTFRKDGSTVPTPMWFGLLDDRRFVVRTEERTAKVRRMRDNPRVRVFASDTRGRPLGPGVEGVARVMTVEEEPDAEAALDRQYGRSRRIYDKVMADVRGMIYVEVVPAAPPAG